MMASLVLTLIGQDRPGLVNSLSEQIAAFDGNWLESRMARLAGKFAGILLVSVPEANVEALTNALRGLESQGLRVTVEKSPREKVVQSHYIFTLELVGQDRRDRRAQVRGATACGRHEHA
jgi:glycine cleavage system regulatory protein